MEESLEKIILELKSEEKEFTLSILIKLKIKDKLKIVYKFYDDSMLAPKRATS